MTPSDRRSAVVQAFRAPDLEPALTELLVPEELVQARSACDRLGTVEFVVAVLGMQGVGKSLLLNALAGRRVVAVGEDETTNVVVRIRAAGSEGERLVVRFRDGRTERHALREDLVRRYTDELENPGNEAGVEDVTCFLDAPLLQEGIVLADTPGAGSLRAANGQVTQDYLPEVSLGLFVLPTVPTLRKSEVQFLRTTWRHSRDFLYVQNHWHAPARELADALATNRRILTELAQAEGDTRPIVIHAVDVCEALEGACNDQPERVAASGLPALVEALRARLAGGAERVHLATNGRVILQTLERAAATARTRLAGLEVGDNEAGADFAARIAAAREDLAAREAAWADARARFAERRDAALAHFGRDLATSLGEAHTRLDAHIEARSIDVARMSDVVSQELSEAARAPLAALDTAWGEATSTLVTAASTFHDATSEGPQGFRFGNIEGIALEAVGEGLHHLGKIGFGAAAGAAAWAGGAALVAGEGGAAALAAAGAAVPGVGWVIAGGALVAGFFLAREGRKKVQAGMRDAVREAIAQARRDWTREATLRIERAAERLERNLDAQVRADSAHARATLDQLVSDHALDRRSREATRERLVGHEARLAAAARTLQGLLRSTVRA